VHSKHGPASAQPSQHTAVCIARLAGGSKRARNARRRARGTKRWLIQAPSAPRASPRPLQQAAASKQLTAGALSPKPSSGMDQAYRSTNPKRGDCDPEARPPRDFRRPAAPVEHDRRYPETCTATASAQRGPEPRSRFRAVRRRIGAGAPGGHPSRDQRRRSVGMN
jgi:hypothetical protein